MSLNFESLSNVARAELLARIAHRLTICARDTYEVGTDGVVEPKVLRAYIELLHRVIGAVGDHILNREGYLLERLLEMIRDFGVTHNCAGYMTWATEPVAHYLVSPEDPQKSN